MSEFGRTPQINYLYGRDHWGTAWSIALAGAGIKAGVAHGPTQHQGAPATGGPGHPGELFQKHLSAVRLEPAADFDVAGRPSPSRIADAAARAIKELLA